MVGKVTKLALSVRTSRPFSVCLRKIRSNKDGQSVKNRLGLRWMCVYRRILTRARLRERSCLTYDVYKATLYKTEVFVLLRCYTAWVGSYRRFGTYCLTHRQELSTNATLIIHHFKIGNPSGPSSRVKQSTLRLSQNVSNY